MPGKPSHSSFFAVRPAALFPRLSTAPSPRIPGAGEGGAGGSEAPPAHRRPRSGWSSSVSACRISRAEHRDVLKKHFDAASEGERSEPGGRAFWSKEYCVLFVENKPTGTPGCFEKTFRCEERGERSSPRPPKYRRPIRPKTSRSTPGGQREPMAPLCKGSCLPWQTEGLPCGENSENLAPKKPKKNAHRVCDERFGFCFPRG